MNLISVLLLNILDDRIILNIKRVKLPKGNDTKLKGLRLKGYDSQLPIVFQYIRMLRYIYGKSSVTTVMRALAGVTVFFITTRRVRNEI